MSIFDAIIAEFTGFFLPKRAIGSFSATVTIEEIGLDELEITQHPVQQGAAITDHAFKKPSELTVTVLQAKNTIPLADIYQTVLALQESRTPMDVITGKRAYKNMLIKSLRQTTDAQTENALSLSFTLQEVFITALEVVTVPEREKQADPGKTGATKNTGKKQLKNTKGASSAAGGGTQESSRRRSALAALAGKKGK